MGTVLQGGVGAHDTVPGSGNPGHALDERVLLPTSHRRRTSHFGRRLCGCKWSRVCMLFSSFYQFNVSTASANVLVMKSNHESKPCR